MPVINGVYLKDFPALPSAVADANIIPIAISGNQIAYRTTVAGIVTDARVTSKLLTGLSVTGSTILATDTILQAFGKVQNQLNGKVSSVGLTMPSAFNVANSPITSAGTLAVTAAGVASQYIRGDGALADFPTTGGGGSSVSYYLNGSVSQGTIGGNTYYEMNKTPVIGTGTDFTIGADGYIAQFITDANDPASLLIPGGNWNVEMYFSASSSGGTPSFYVEVYKYDGTTFTLLGSSSATPEGITNGTAIDIYYTSVGIPETVLTITDRLAIRVYVTHSGRTITLHTEDNHLSEIVTTFSNGLTTLNGLTKQAQYFAVGSTGTDFNISSSVDTHTFNIPDASASARGLITTGTQTIAGAKTVSSTLASTFVGQFFENTGASTSAKLIRISNTSGDLALGLEGATPTEIPIAEGGIAYAGVLKTVGSKSLILGTLSKAALTINTSQQVTLAQGLTGTTANFTGQLTLGSTITNGTYTYTLPSATGTLALTSDIHSAVTLSAIGSTPNANAATLTGQVLNLEPASASFGGVVTTGTQTFAGVKTFNSGIVTNTTSTVGVTATSTTNNAIQGSATTGSAIYGSTTGTGSAISGFCFGQAIAGSFSNTTTSLATLFVQQNGTANVALFQTPTTNVIISNNGSISGVNSLTLSGTLSNGTYTYTLPSATGTLALTSALSSYLPLSGGTLSGTLTLGNGELQSSTTLKLGANATTIYLRPNGTNNSTGQVSIDNTGAATFSSSVSVGDFLRLTKASSVDIQAYTGAAYTNLNYDAASHNWQTSGGTAKMVLTSGGNVGIGTAPSYPLHLKNATFSQLYIEGGSAADLILYNSGGSANTRTMVYRQGTGGTTKFFSANDAGTINQDNILVLNNATGYVWVNGAISGFTGSGVQMQVNGQSRFGGTIILHNTSNASQTATFNCTAASTVTIADNVVIVGSLSKGSGSFRIEHPLPSLSETHQLVHSFIEGPKADLIYRGKLTLVNGKAQANIDEVSTMTEGTFEVLCREVQCFTTNESGWDLVKGKVIGNIIYIESQNQNSTDEISWMVIGERKDKHMMDTDWTDENGKVIVEPLKPIEPEIEPEIIKPEIIEDLLKGEPIIPTGNNLE